MLEERRTANGGDPDPLPPELALAYILDILPAFGYLHRNGLLFCDFKPDNVIQIEGSLKLIDLGAVYRMDDTESPIYGTKGFQAPEIADTGPTAPSDLFTVGRTLAVLCTPFRGYQNTYEYTLPSVDDVPLYATYDSLYQLLLRATAAHPDDRFQTADEMADQLYGVLREVVAARGGLRRSGAEHPLHQRATRRARTPPTGRRSRRCSWHRTISAPGSSPRSPASPTRTSSRRYSRKHRSERSR